MLAERHMASNGARNYSLEPQIASIGPAGTAMACSRRVPARLARKQRGKGASVNHGYFVLIMLALLALVSAPAESSASELKDQTRVALDSYVRSACLRLEARARESSFLRISDLPDRRLHVHAGETLVWREGDGRPATAPHGLIHDWIGAV